MNLSSVGTNNLSNSSQIRKIYLNNDLVITTEIEKEAEVFFNDIRETFARKTINYRIVRNMLAIFLP